MNINRFNNSTQQRKREKNKNVLFILSINRKSATFSIEGTYLSDSSLNSYSWRKRRIERHKANSIWAVIICCIWHQIGSQIQSEFLKEELSVYTLLNPWPNVHFVLVDTLSNFFQCTRKTLYLSYEIDRSRTTLHIVIYYSLSLRWLAAGIYSSRSLIRYSRQWYSILLVEI